jgi:hypothetical protein
MNNKNKRILSGLTLTTFYICLLLLISGCSIKKPDLKKDYFGLSNIEKKMQYRFDRCVYMQQFVKKIDLRCTDLLLENRKITNILDFGTMKKDSQLPKLYNQKGEYDMTFDDFYKYVK